MIPLSEPLGFLTPRGVDSWAARTSKAPSLSLVVLNRGHFHGPGWIIKARRSDGAVRPLTTISEAGQQFPVVTAHPTQGNRYHSITTSTTELVSLGRRHRTMVA